MNFENIQQNKFEIKRENIIPLSELPEKMSPELKSLGWPLECQGSGRLLEDGKNFQVRYPNGDSLYSWTVIIHELGHLRQNEFNEDIKNAKNDHEENLAMEKDAAIRGLERIKKYCPDVLDKLESEFKKFKQENKIPDFNSFKDLYQDFNNSNFKINKTLGLEDELNIIYEKLKAINIQDFFNRIEENKVNTKINTQEAEDIIFKVIGEIIKE
jgi:hypothetical protein